MNFWYAVCPRICSDISLSSQHTLGSLDLDTCSSYSRLYPNHITSLDVDLVLNKLLWNEWMHIWMNQWVNLSSSPISCPEPSSRSRSFHSSQLQAMYIPRSRCSLVGDQHSLCPRSFEAGNFFFFELVTQIYGNLKLIMVRIFMVRISVNAAHSRSEEI